MGECIEANSYVSGVIKASGFMTLEECEQGCVDCSVDNDCHYCYISYNFGGEKWKITVTGAGTYDVGSGGTQEGSFNINGTYYQDNTSVWQGGPYYYLRSSEPSGNPFYWNGDSGAPCETNSNACFQIQFLPAWNAPNGAGYYIYGQGPDGFPAWKFSINLGGCTPWSTSNITKVTANPGFITINDPAPTITVEEWPGTTRDSCINAGGVYEEGSHYPDLTLGCSFYSIIPPGTEDMFSYCQSLGGVPANPDPDIFYSLDDPVVWKSLANGKCCNDLCFPPKYNSGCGTFNNQCP